ncbi:MAG: oxygen-independent coproporphyrinogen III oxidase [Burkholderiales bacterium]|nr:oxygen-independent coproporphyrinogen III oxidase [Burkholderiales bacterium]
MQIAPAPLEIDRDLVVRFDMPGPRYTSYPTADRFVEAFDAAAYAAWLAKRTIGGISRPLSLYVHLPFCASICYYCACNKVITRDHGRSSKYLRYLEKEIRLQADTLTGARRITQLHWGGGTPTFLSHGEMTELMAMLREHFEFAPDGEYAIEVDPRTADAATIGLLARLGFNRMSLGIQDIDPAVQKAINRIQPVEMTRDVLAAARAAGFRSVNFDLIYGLPRQSVDSFSRTLDEVVAEAPERIALYSYAHLPTRFKPQRRIADADMPSGETKLALFLLAVRRLLEAGYVYIGLDHFAKPDDELAQALRSGRLHRNFQGYTTQSECDLIALGVSAIGKVGPVYSQNVRTLDEYYDCLDQGRLPVTRGIELNADDLVRRTVIMALMCQGQVDFESIAIAHLIDFREYFAPELAELGSFERAGLVRVGRGEITVTPKGRFFLRGICMLFDRYLQADRVRNRYSRII